jgi:hypothetical protein
MELVILLTVAFVVYVFVIRRRGRGAFLNTAAHGGAGGARHALGNYFRRTDRILYVTAVVANGVSGARATHCRWSRLPRYC